MATSRTPSLTPSPSRSPSPELPIQPDHFYGCEDVHILPSPHSDGKAWLGPNDDPLAHRGIPVFKPSLEEFHDFEGYMTRIECWGALSGIVKVIPPEEWTRSLPPLKQQLTQVKIKSPIEQVMLGRGGLFRQENIEKRKVMSVREWAELCSKDEFKAPGIDDVGLHARSANNKPKTRRIRKKGDMVKAESAEREPSGDANVVAEELDDEHVTPYAEDSNNKPSVASPPNSVDDAPEAEQACIGSGSAEPETDSVLPDGVPKPKAKRTAYSKEAREANLAEKHARDMEFLETFDPHTDWLPPNTKASDYTPDFCQKLERQYWRNCGLGRPAWYGADTQGSLYTDETKLWNVAHLPSTLTRLLPASSQGLPGVNTPYLYFGMWRATFAWHVEDMDLFSINYIHFGAPKFWYAVPQGRAAALEQTMRGYFPKDTSQCPQFLRHKSFLASPTLLAQSSCRPNHLVQHAGEFVITFPRGYHAGFNLGFNCAESVNFGLDSWLELGKKAKVCECVSDSVRIDVNQLLMERALAVEPPTPDKPKRPHKFHADKDGKQHSNKRKSDADPGSKVKRTKVKPSPADLPSSQASPSKLPKVHITLKLGPKPVEEPYPCCLCISTSEEGLLRVQEPPIGRKDIAEAAGNPSIWMAHEMCANVVPETWVDEIEGESFSKEKVVFGVDAIVKDRWNLKCSACTKTRAKAHGAPIQCTKGKCPKAFHVSCARDGKDNGILFEVLREVEKEVVLLDPAVPESALNISATNQMQIDPAIPMHGQSPAVDINTAPSSVPAAADGLSGARFLKVIKKVEVQVLCSQHNPAIAALKKSQKQDKIRNDLVALPSMARIKIRVSAGVFEVSLIRVIEETKSVEVLWDRGVKREFKWGSVVFGNTDGPVQQKPSEIAPESERRSMPVVTYSSVSAATAQHLQSPPTMVASHQPGNIAGPSQIASSHPQYSYPPHSSSPYDYWSYHGQNQHVVAGASMTAHYPSIYSYANYYRNLATIPTTAQYNAYLYTQSGYRGGQLQWQQPYQGPSNYYQSTGPGPGQETAQSEQTQSISTSPQAFAPSDNPQPATTNPSPPDKQINSPSNPVAHPLPEATPPTQSTAHESLDTPPTQTSMTTDLCDIQKALNDLSALTSLQPTEIANILQNNPALRDIVMTAFDKQEGKDL